MTLSKNNGLETKQPGPAGEMCHHSNCPRHAITTPNPNTVSKTQTFQLKPTTNDILEPSGSEKSQHVSYSRTFWFRMVLEPSCRTIIFSNLLLRNGPPDGSNLPNQKIQARIFWLGINYSPDYSGSESRVYSC